MVSGEGLAGRSAAHTAPKTSAEPFVFLRAASNISPPLCSGLSHRGTSENTKGAVEGGEITDEPTDDTGGYASIRGILVVNRLEFVLD